MELLIDAEASRSQPPLLPRLSIHIQQHAPFRWNHARHENIILAIEIIGGFFVLMFFFLLIAIERHQRKIAEVLKIKE